MGICSCATPSGQEGGAVIRLTVSKDRALDALNRVDHSTFTKARADHWLVHSDGCVSGPSVCWLFCWGKTDSKATERAAALARAAFNEVLDIRFDEFDAIVDHEDAQLWRYLTERASVVDSRLESLLPPPHGTG